MKNLRLFQFGKIWKEHPMNNEVIFVCRFSNMDFILPFNHNDCESLEIDLTRSKSKKFCWNKKDFYNPILG